MKRFVAVLAIVALCAVNGAGAPRKKYRFAVVPKMLNNPVFNCGKIAAEKTAKEIGEKEGVEIEILWKAPAVSNPAEQASLVESLANQKVDGISVSVDEAGTLRKAIDYAVDKGVPVMTFDSDSPKSKRKYFFGTDDIECGETLAQHMGALVKKGKVVIQSGTTGAPNLQNRVKGVKDYLARNHPDIQVIDVLFCNDDLKKAIDDIASYTNAHPDLSGWILVGGWALFGKDALKAIDPAKTKVVSCDALPEMWPYLESGKCQVLLAQDLWGWGEQSVKILKALADGKPVEAGAGGILKGKLEPVTKETLPDFKKKWAERFGAVK